MADFLVFSQAIAGAKNQPDATYDGLCKLAGQLIGVKLFTLTAIDNSRRQARRIYSNMPRAYPVHGTKPMRDDAWSHKVLYRHETFLANSVKAIAEVFPDHELIRSLGCGSVINVPVVVAGQVLGTVNCLHEAGHYSPGRLSLSDRLKTPGAAAFLLNISSIFLGDRDG